MDVDSHRQRLIFQGRVLKDDKQLTDYANLDDGKVIHLVIRPADAPHNPLNDDPSTGNRTRTLPSLTSRYPLMEGYAFITLDSNNTNTHSWLSNVLNRFTPSTQAAGRSPNTPITLNTERSSSALPFPPSVEVRLVRTLGSIRNVRGMIDSNEDIRSSAIPHSTPEQIEEIRQRLRASGSNQQAQIALVLDELATLLTETVPRMQELSTNLNNTDTQMDMLRSLLHMSRIIQGISLITHFMGSVLVTTNTDTTAPTRRPSSQTTTPATTTTTTPRTTGSPSLVRLPSYLLPTGNTEAIRTPSTTANTTTKRSPLSSSSGGCSTAKKRKLDDKKDHKKDKKGKKKDK